MNELILLDRHPSDDDLVLRFYGECGDDEQAGLDAHLARCADCRGRWQTLVGTLDLVNLAAIPEPDAGFEEAVWAKVAVRLPRPHPRQWSGRTFAVVASWAAMVALVAGVSYAGRRRVPVAGPTASIESSAAIVTTGARSGTRERVLLTALVDQFAQTEMLLIEVLNAPTGNTDDLAFEQGLASDLVASGRLYRETALQTGNTAAVDTLDDLNGVLVELAREPATIDPHELDALRSRITDNGLLFKVRAESNDMRDRQRALALESE